MAESTAIQLVFILSFGYTCKPSLKMLHLLWLGWILFAIWYVLCATQNLLFAQASGGGNPFRRGREKEKQTNTGHESRLMG